MRACVRACVCVCVCVYIDLSVCIIIVYNNVCVHAHVWQCAHVVITYDTLFTTLALYLVLQEIRNTCIPHPTANTILIS